MNRLQAFSYQAQPLEKRDYGLPPAELCLSDKKRDSVRELYFCLADAGQGYVFPGRDGNPLMKRALLSAVD